MRDLQGAGGIDRFGSVQGLPKLPEQVGVTKDIGIKIGPHVASRGPVPPVQCVDLARLGVRDAQQLPPPRLGPRDHGGNDVFGSVRAGVGRNDDLQRSAAVVLIQKRPQTLADPVGLVVGGNNDRHRAALGPGYCRAVVRLSHSCPSTRISAPQISGIVPTKKPRTVDKVGKCRQFPREPRIDRDCRI